MSGTDQEYAEAYSDAETERRASAALKRMLEIPPKPHKDNKVRRQ
jgi:hypothetical protein